MKRILALMVTILIAGVLVFGSCAPAAAPSSGGADCSDYEDQIADLEKELAEAKKAAPAAEAEYEWRFSSFQPVGSPSERTSATFCALLNGMSDGRIHVKYYNNSVLGGSEENFDAISRGTLEMGEISPYSGFSMLQNIKGIPYAGATWEAFDALFYGDGIIGNIIMDSWAANGMKGLFQLEIGPLCYINTERPLVTPDDFAGLKFRIPPSDVYVKSFQRACPQGIGETIAWSEVYTSLERGVIDGSTMYMGFYVSTFWEVAKYYTDVNQCYIFDTVLMNQDLFDSLPADLKDLVMEAASRAEDYGRFVYRKEYGQSVEIVEERGCEVTQLTAEQRQLFIDNLDPEGLWEELYKDMLEEYYPGENMYEKVVAEVKKVL